MILHLNDPEVNLVKLALDRAGFGSSVLSNELQAGRRALTFAAATSIFAAEQRYHEPKPTLRPKLNDYVAAAYELPFVSVGECDIDYVVNRGDAGGAYVMAWVWVSDAHAAVML